MTTAGNLGYTGTITPWNFKWLASAMVISAFLWWQGYPRTNADVCVCQSLPYRHPPVPAQPQVKDGALKCDCVPWHYWLGGTKWNAPNHPGEEFELSSISPNHSSPEHMSSEPLSQMRLASSLHSYVCSQPISTSSAVAKLAMCYVCGSAPFIYTLWQWTHQAYKVRTRRPWIGE